MFIFTILRKALGNSAQSLVAILSISLVSRKDTEVFGQKRVEKNSRIALQEKNIGLGCKTQAITQFIVGLLKIKVDLNNVLFVKQQKKEHMIGQMLITNIKEILMIIYDFVDRVTENMTIKNFRNYEKAMAELV